MSDKKLSRREMLKVMGLTSAAAVLAACAPGAPQAAPTTAATSAPAAVAGAANTAPAAPTAAPAAKGPVDISIMVSANCPGGGNSEKTTAVQKRILDETGVKVNTYLVDPTGSNYTEKLNVILASGSQPLDLFEANWTDFKQAIVPVDDLLKQYGPDILRMNKDAAWKQMKDDQGKTWGYPRLGLFAHSYFPWFRSDWLAEAGLKAPTTWAEMESAIAAMKQKHPEAVVGATGRGDLMSNTLGAFVEGGNARWVDPADKMVKPVEVNPGYKDWVAKMNEWWQKDWFQKESFASPDWRAILKTLNVSTWLGWYSRITIWWEQIRTDAKYQKEDYELTVLTGPKGLAKTIYNGGPSAYMIPRKSKNPDAVIRYANWMYKGLPDDPTNVIMTLAGIEGTDWQWTDKAAHKFKNIVPTTAKCEEKYPGDFYQSKGMGTELTYLQTEPDGRVNRHVNHIVTYALKFDTGKMPLDVDVPYDTAAIGKQFPGQTDLNRLLDEESIKFITGVRPLSEWDAFMKQVDGAGLKQWSQLYTEQYRKYHPA